MAPKSRRRSAWRRSLAAVGTPPSVAAGAAVGVLTGYLGVLTVAGTIADRRNRRRGASASAGRMRFAIMVPAHDEETVIERSLTSMLALDYPSDSYEVHVVGDNCTDNTLKVVREVGANAHERIDPEHPGKGAALNWLHARLQAITPAFDCYVIVDADTSLDPRFLAEMEAAFDRGATAAQGFYDVRDADESVAAGLRAAALACRHHLRPLGRRSLGGSSGLFGNGMAFTSAVLADRQWSGHLTEDLEFQLAMLLDGEIVEYVPAARLQAEIPHELDASVSQNQRWELGRIQVAKAFLPRLVRRVLGRSSSHRVAEADAVLDQLVPPLSVLVAAQIVVDAAAVALVVLSPSRGRRRLLTAASASTAVLVGHVFAGLRAVDAPPSVYRSLGGAPKMLVWKVRLWLGVLGGRSQVGWSRTGRNATAAEPTGDTVEDDA